MLILAVIIVLACTAVALAGWGAVTLIRGDKEAKAPPKRASSPAATSGAGRTAEGRTAQQGREAGGGGEAADAVTARTGESTRYEEPEDRYITETQRHQNFFKALAEGKIRRLEVTATDFQPAGDANSSHLYVILTMTDNSRSDGTIVMKYSGGKWRIATVRLTGALAGGTEYNVPSSFGADLAREIEAQQNFLRKVAEGRLAYMSISSAAPAGSGEVLLTGVAASRGNNTYPAKIRLRNDYGIWHLTDIDAF